MCKAACKGICKSKREECKEKRKDEEKIEHGDLSDGNDLHEFEDVDEGDEKLDNNELYHNQ